MEVPIARLGTGKRTLYVRASDENGMTIADADLALDVSLAGQPPYLRVTACEKHPKDDHSTTLEVKIGERTQACQTFDGINVKLVIDANPNAKVTLAGQTVTIPPSGTIAHVVDLGDRVLCRSTRSLPTRRGTRRQSRPSLFPTRSRATARSWTATSRSSRTSKAPGSPPAI